MAPLLRKLAGAGIYLAFLIAVAELVLQGFYYLTAGDFLFRRHALAIYTPNEHSIYNVKPNLAIEHVTNEFSTRIITNRQGFRVPSPDRVYSSEPPPGTFRMMLLGPSFAFGWGVDYEDSVGALLEDSLARARIRGSERVEVINAGVPALVPGLHLEWFRHEGARLKPDLVVQFLYGSMIPAMVSQRQYVVTPEGYLERPDRSRTRRIQAVVKNSALVFYGWTTYTRLKSQGSGPDAEPDEVEGAGRHLALVDEFSLDDPEVRRGFDFYQEFRRTVEAAGAEMLIIYFPLSYVVHPQDMARWQHLGVRDVETQVAFDAAFCRSLQEQGVPCFNLTDSLRRAATEGDRLYYWLDIHWTPRGNEVAAEAVSAHLLGSDITAGRDGS